jgi:hypothetical protein
MGVFQRLGKDFQKPPFIFIAGIAQKFHGSFKRLQNEY